jgi:hypothetical protein
LFWKEIKPDDPEYKKKVYAEALYRYFEYQEKNCTCSLCRNEKEKLYAYLKENFRKV